MCGCNSSYHDINTRDSRDLFAPTVLHHPLGSRALWVHPSDVEFDVPWVPVNTHSHTQEKLTFHSAGLAYFDGGKLTCELHRHGFLQNCWSCELAQGRSWFFMGVVFITQPLVAFYSSEASLKQRRRIHADSTAFVHLCRLTFITHEARGRMSPSHVCLRSITYAAAFLMRTYGGEEANTE